MCIRDRAVLDDTERAGQLAFPQIDFSVNDIALPFMAALPPRIAARLAVESAETLDRRLEVFPAHLLNQLNTHNARWVDRSLHRNEHLDEIEAALNAL